MRTRSVALIVFSVAIQAFCAGPAVARAHHVSHKVKHAVKHAVIRVAPADEYFGRLKMSILEIRNQLRDLDLRLQFDPAKSEDVIGSAAMVEDALHDWERKYPSDPWLAKDVFQLAHLYSQIQTEHGHQVALRTVHWLYGRYGRTPYAAQAKVQLANLK